MNLILHLILFKLYLILSEAIEASSDCGEKVFMSQVPIEFISDDEKSFNENIKIHDSCVLNEGCFLVNQIIVHFQQLIIGHPGYFR